MWAWELRTTNKGIITGKGRNRVSKGHESACPVFAKRGKPQRQTWGRHIGSPINAKGATHCLRITSSVQIAVGEAGGEAMKIRGGGP